MISIAEVLEDDVIDARGRVIWTEVIIDTWGLWRRFDKVWFHRLCLRFVSMRESMRDRREEDRVRRA